MLTTYLKTKLEIAMTLDFRSDLFQQAQRLSMAYHDQRRSGMVIYIINSLAGAPGSVMMSGLPFAQNVLTLVGMFWVSYRLNPTLALLSLSIVPFLYYSVGYYSRHIRQRLFTSRGWRARRSSIIHEAMSMLRVIVAFGREDHEHARFREQGGARSTRASTSPCGRRSFHSRSIRRPRSAPRWSSATAPISCCSSS